jgi:hypothetical protein
MEIADPNFLVKKPAKPRTPAQQAATEKGLAALKARRNELAQKVTKLKAAGPAPVKKAAKVVAPAPAPVVEESEEDEEEVPVPAPAPKPAKAKKAAVVAPAPAPAFDPESMISAIALRVTESLAIRAPKKKVKRVVYEEESSSEEEVVMRRPKPKAVAAPPPAPVALPPAPPAPRPMPANVAKSNVLSRLFSV